VTVKRCSCLLASMVLARLPGLKSSGAPTMPPAVCTDQATRSCHAYISAGNQSVLVRRSTHLLDTTIFHNTARCLASSNAASVFGRTVYKAVH
jgi:hypothetical protein